MDAFASWDHHIALFEKKGLARVLKSGSALGVVMMGRQFLESRPDDAARFLGAYKLAYLYFAEHESDVDGWFAKIAGGALDVSVLKTVADIEPNTRASGLADVNVMISEVNIKTMQAAADFAFSQGLIKQRLQIATCVAREPARRAGELPGLQGVVVTSTAPGE